MINPIAALAALDQLDAFHRDLIVRRLSAAASDEDHATGAEECPWAWRHFDGGTGEGSSRPTA